MQEYDSVRDKIQKIIMEQFIHDTLIHDEFLETAAVYAAKVKNPLGSDDLALAEALAIPEEAPLWKKAMRIELISLLQKEMH